MKDSMRFRLTVLTIVCGLGWYAGLRRTEAAVPALPKPGPISFNRDIRPILSENCYYCHGPDSNRRNRSVGTDPMRLGISSGE